MRVIQIISLFERNRLQLNHRARVAARLHCIRARKAVEQIVHRAVFLHDHHDVPDVVPQGGGRSFEIAQSRVTASRAPQDDQTKRCNCQHARHRKVLQRRSAPFRFPAQPVPDCLHRLLAPARPSGGIGGCHRAGVNRCPAVRRKASSSENPAAHAVPERARTAAGFALSRDSQRDRRM